MALYPCPECKREISTDAKVCPHCGKKAGGAATHARWKAMPKGMRFFLLGSAVFFVLAMLVSNAPDKDKPTNTAAPAPAAASTPRKAHTEAQLESALTAVKKRDKVLSASWNNKSLPSLLVGVNGSGKAPGAFDSYARGICGVLAAEGIDGAFVHVLDNNASGWVELGKAECPNR